MQTFGVGAGVKAKGTRAPGTHARVSTTCVRTPLEGARAGGSRVRVNETRACVPMTDARVTGTCARMLLEGASAREALGRVSETSVRIPGTHARVGGHDDEAEEGGRKVRAGNWPLKLLVPPLILAQAPCKWTAAAPA